MQLDRISPVTDDPESAPFFAAAREGRLAVRICDHCSNGIFPPTVHCPSCGSFDTPWRDVRGSGSLYSWTTVTHAVHPGYPVPYTIVVVQLDDVTRVKMPGMLPGAPALEADMAMAAWFETLADGVVIPQWKPASTLSSPDR